MNPASIKYRQLKAFALVVETGSFRAAADKLSVTQPSLSALIKDLEDDIGVALLERTTRSSGTTEAGRVFYEDIRGSLQQLEVSYRYVKEVGRGSRGRLSLAALPSLAAGIVTRAVGEFRRANPAVRIHLTERRNDKVLDAVRQGEVEVGIGSMWQTDEELEFQELFRDRMMFVAPAGHAIGTMRPTLKLADQFDLVLMRAGPTEFALRTSGTTRPVAFEVEHLATAIAMVRHGFGISILPSSVRTVMNMDGLVCREIEGNTATRRLGIVVRRGSQPSAAARRFLDFLRAAQEDETGLGVSRSRLHKRTTSKG